jgi:predicted dehydrogenase
MVARQVKVGVIGCGIISEPYLRTLSQFQDIDVVACGDVQPEKAQARAAEFGLERSGGPDVVLQDDSIEIVVNLTVPVAHAEVSLAAIEQGKSVWSEKPLALSFAEGAFLLRRAKEQGVLVGCAPDTVLGGGLQTGRRLVEAGAIGEPVSAVAFLHNRGAEQRRPDPEFYYRPGVGPMYDMGPYYLSALVGFLGPVRRVSGAARMTFPEREVLLGPNAGKRFAVEVMTDVSGLLEFASGPIAVMTMSADVWATNLPKLEVYGTDSSISLPDPNRFDGACRLFDPKERVWREIGPSAPYAGSMRFGHRGLGVAEMAAALLEGREPRANGRLALHVLEVIEALHRSAERGERVDLVSLCEIPPVLPDEEEFVVLPGRSA